MNDQTRKLLFDVLDSGRSICAWCAGRSFAEYEADRQFRRAVEREFEIIGEALNQLSHADLYTASRVYAHEWKNSLNKCDVLAELMRNYLRRSV